MFKQRLISGVILVILTVITLYLGGNVTFGVIGIISLIGYFELMRVVKVEKTVLSLAGYLTICAYYGMILTKKEEYVMPLILGAMILFLAIYVFSFPVYASGQIMAAFFGLFYVGIMLSYIYKLRMLPKGGALVVLIFLSAWGNDTLAYCTGMLIGKHKMAPKLSPKKTIEGAVGGVLGAALLGAVYGAILGGLIDFPYNTILLFAIVCGISGMISIVGDLAASAIKRNYEIKDYGNLIPGHGGILDRFDSIIFTAPIVYYLMIYLTSGVL